MVKYRTTVIINLIIAIFLSLILILSLSTPIGIFPPLGSLLLPGNGIWKIPHEVPEYEELIVPNLSNDASVFRDINGVPHIYGKNLTDIAFALGYCHAQDRWFQMDMARRMARGLLSEILGPSSLEQDMFNKLKMQEYWANETLKAFKTSRDPVVQELYQIFLMYVEGVNTYLDTHTDAKTFEYYFLDVEIRPWELLDVFSVIKFISEYFTWDYYDFLLYDIVDSLGMEDYTQLYGFPFPYQIPVTPDYGQYDDISFPKSINNSSPISLKTHSSLESTTSALPKIVNQFLNGLKQLPQEYERLKRDPFREIGSNNWVVSGNKTATGKPMLATDMHLGWTLPGMWYEAHLVDTSSDFNIYGLCLPGIPIPICGNTRHVGWAMTIAMYDLLDWYYYNGINDTHYYYKGKATKYETLDVAIPVNGQKPEKFTIKSTVHGPVFTGLVKSVSDDFSDYVIACKWVSHNITKDHLAIWGYINAKNAFELHEASRNLELLPVNIAFADIYGNIGMDPNAKVPIRNDTNLPEWHLGSGKMPYNGSKGEGEWIGYVPFEDLPHSMNPSQGYLVSANQVIAGPDFPNVSSLNRPGAADGYRARRLNNLLASKNQITIEDMKRFQTDVYSIRAGNFTPYLLAALNSLPSLDSTQQKVVNELNTWNYVMDKDDVAPTLFNIWVEAYQFLTFQDELDLFNINRYPSWPVLEKLTKEDENSKWFDNLDTENIETRDEIIIDALSLALDALIEFFKSDESISEWTWGEIHQYYFSHLSGISTLSAGPFPGDGTGYTVSPSFTRNLVDGTIRKSSARGGASERIIIDFSNFNNSLSVIPSGQRGISSSKHYTDQLLELFLKDKYHLQYFNADTPQKIQTWTQIESTIIFKSGGS